MRLPDIGPLAKLDPGARALVLAQVVRAELAQHRDLCWTGKSSTSPPLLQSLRDILSESASIIGSLANTSGPIGQLPNEILSTIFEFVPGEEVDTSSMASFGYLRTVNIRDVLTLTTVCRWWRRVALGTPLLWSTVCDNRIPDTARQHMFQYAGGALSVICDNLISDFTLDVLQTHGERVQQLYALGSPALAALANTSLPNLEHCIIRYASSCSSAPLSPLSSGECVRLRSLVLHCACFLPSFPLPSLTHLMISKPTRLQSGTLYTIDNLLDFIVGSPRLRELRLYRLACFGIGTMVEKWSLTSSPIRFAHLEKLCILEMQHSRGYPLEPKLMPLLDVLLPRILFPDTCVVRIGQLRPLELRRCLEHLGRSRRATRMCLESADEESPRQRQSLVLTDAEHAHYTCLDVSIGDHEGGHPFYLLDALSLPIFQTVRELCTDAASGFGWPSEVFAALPHLETFAVFSGCCANVSLCGGKDHVWALKPDEPSGTVTCPQLSTLVCRVRSEEDEVYVRELAAVRARVGHALGRVLVWQQEESASTPTYAVREYSGEGSLVRSCEGIDVEALALRAWATAAPPGCPDWMVGQMYHPSVSS